MLGEGFQFNVCLPLLAGLRGQYVHRPLGSKHKLIHTP